MQLRHSLILKLPIVKKPSCNMLECQCVFHNRSNYCKSTDSLARNRQEIIIFNARLVLRHRASQKWKHQGKSRQGKCLPEASIQAKPEGFPESSFLCLNCWTALFLLDDRLDQLNEDVAHIVLPKCIQTLQKGFAYQFEPFQLSS